MCRPRRARRGPAPPARRKRCGGCGPPGPGGGLKKRRKKKRKKRGGGGEEGKKKPAKGKIKIKKLKEPPDPGAGEGGRDPLPFLLPLPHSFLPRSFTRPPAARRRFMPAALGPLGAAAPPRPAPAAPPPLQLRLFPQTRAGAPRSNRGCCIPPGPALLLPCSAADRQLPGKKNKNKTKRGSFKFPSRALRQTIGKRRPRRRCQPDAARL